MREDRPNVGLVGNPLGAGVTPFAEVATASMDAETVELALVLPFDHVFRNVLIDRYHCVTP
jgi:hypothetical protein